ncbi:L-serine ammonia-lyase [Roseimaritima ulvae]|uniref:L-serine dehydratase n=2 Tax=Roseimaritima ulvae TaxID=980254 RepID=A0A5B9QR06_9BACT|nr:L-serine ammonia-lyase [Roseimaritima ulvae]QEG39855.1 L-serine dehydratase TdcG [Roseimaritima ulvae]
MSVLELFTIGIGPSSSHTVGPMRAAKRFVERLQSASLLEQTARIEVHLYASLALTGKGHGTDTAILLGLVGETPETVDVDAVPTRLQQIRKSKTLPLTAGVEIEFDERTDMLYHRKESLPAHPNGLRFIARDAASDNLMEKIYYSVGGGFVVGEHAAADDQVPHADVQRPYPYRSGEDLLRLSRESDLSVSEMTLRNEAGWREEQQTREGLLNVWRAMQQCVTRGCEREGTLPGGLKVPRRAPQLLRKLQSSDGGAAGDPLITMDWVSMWAIAVNEENAAGGRVVTAPTNGAAGIIPAVLHYFATRHADVQDDQIIRFLLTAGAIGILYKLNASISGAEVGCQGEVGVACSMAAGALCEVMGGTVAQVENAAEIGMEHNLGLTCDPIGGLVQVPCIERNAMGAIKAINAARLALHGDGQHRVSLDKVIRTMRQTGADMSDKYKETSRGGLAVNVPEC